MRYTRNAYQFDYFFNSVKSLENTAEDFKTIFITTKFCCACLQMNDKFYGLHIRQKAFVLHSSYSYKFHYVFNSLTL